MIKNDFTNLLDQEIERMEKLRDAIKEEIAAREYQNTGYDNDIVKASPVDIAVNKKQIVILQGELKAKEDSIAKLREKKMFDDAEREESYQDYLENRHKVIMASEREKNVHFVAIFEYLKKELFLYEEEKNKEAIIYYFCSLRDTVEDRGHKY